jgi:hypothetical protein
MPRIVFASPGAQWLLGLAALCMLAQSTLLPLASAPASAWTPVHRHLTLSGVVPPHTHNYEGNPKAAATGPSCVVTDASASAGGAHNEPVVCAADDSASTTVTATVQHEPSALPVALRGIEALTSLASEGPWPSVVLAILTPPPRA